MLALILDDSPSSLAHLQRLARSAGAVDIQAFLHPREALAAIERQRFDVAIVDHVMSSMDGIAFVKALRATPNHGRIPVLMVTASEDRQTRLAALEAGANDVLAKSPHPLELQAKMRNLFLVAEAVRVLDQRVEDLEIAVEAAVRDRLAREEEMIFRLSKAVEFRDTDTGDHTIRVATYSRMIAEELGLDAEFCRRLFLASPLHDVGKVAIPDRILLKPDRLDPEEMAVIRTHAAVGAKILGDSGCATIRLAAEIAAHHHERWDGAGYPQGLTGDVIPLSARIVAIADVFDALTTKRPYKDAMSRDQAMAYVEKETGRHFDPCCVAAFVAAMGKVPDDARPSGGI